MDGSVLSQCAKDDSIFGTRLFYFWNMGKKGSRERANELRVLVVYRGGLGYFLQLPNLGLDIWRRL